MLRGKDLVAVREGLEFDAVARWVQDEHGPLLSWFALESDGGRYEKRYPVSGYPLTKGPPCFGVQHRPEMTQRDIDSVNFRCHCWFDDSRDVRRDLIAKEVNVDPMVRLAANATPENISIELRVDSISVTGNARWNAPDMPTPTQWYRGVSM